ncbi:SMC-Scp complex subunit ScpB [Macrococcus sp. DPC7161]|uniref:SMC-Scp complex subunit ScpB n=1 Tax=Macrococcus sp. DPC7161 TaxID=2507060 RepID=UPI00100A365F|nr:SMC-Scp complex subunit ScpB [Macrococcus sp. DPC7161]RXK19304.1 SMC-Scp complex subunit ScpB [Macrococcus sp. DPC7161]
MKTSKLDIIIGLLYALGDEGINEHTLAKIVSLTEFQLSDTIKDFYHPILKIEKYGNHYYLMTSESLKPYLEQLVTVQNEKKLTQASLETLAIIAYNQPVTRHEIEITRGVNSDGPVKTLIEKGLVEAKYSGESRSQLLQTTELFLVTFGLNSLDDLPQDEQLTTTEDEMDLFFSTLEGE